MSLIFLIGMPAAGKSYWAQKLAAAFGIEYIDLDLRIEEETGKTIPEIFSEEGEVFFRRQEEIMLSAVINGSHTDTIIASGGGTPCYFDNMDKMLQSGSVIYLHADIDTLISRLSAQPKERPLLTVVDIRQKLQQLLDLRKPVFEKAHHILKVENISLANFEEIIASCTNRH